MDWLEPIQDLFWDEARTGCIEMSIPVAGLLGDIKPQGNAQGQAVFGTGHGDIEEPTFFLDLVTGPDPEIGGNAAVNCVEYEDRLPFLPFGGLVLSRLRSGLSTHLGGLSFECQGTFSS